MIHYALRAGREASWTKCIHGSLTQYGDPSIYQRMSQNVKYISDFIFICFWIIPPDQCPEQTTTTTVTNTRQAKETSIFEHKHRAWLSEKCECNGFNSIFFLVEWKSSKYFKVIICLIKKGQRLFICCQRSPWLGEQGCFKQRAKGLFFCSFRIFFWSGPINVLWISYPYPLRSNWPPYFPRITSQPIIGVWMHFLSKNSKHWDNCLGRLGVIGLPYSPINFLIPPQVTRPGPQPQPPGAASPEAGVRSVRFLRKYSQSYAFYVCFGHTPRL